MACGNLSSEFTAVQSDQVKQNHLNIEARCVFGFSQFVELFVGSVLWEYDILDILQLPQQRERLLQRFGPKRLQFRLNAVEEDWKVSIDAQCKNRLSSLDVLTLILG